MQWLTLGAAIFWELRQSDPVIQLATAQVAQLRHRQSVLFRLWRRTVRVDHDDSADPAIALRVSRHRCGTCAWAQALSSSRCWRRWGRSWCNERLIQPRILLLGAVLVVGLSFLHYSHFNLDTDYSHYAWARALQGLGYAFFFVPLSVIAYSQLKPSENNKASSLTNFFRNWGGSFGIAFINTVSERRLSFHQERVGEQPAGIVGRAAAAGAASCGLPPAARFLARRCHARGNGALLQPTAGAIAFAGVYGLFPSDRRVDPGRRAAGTVDQELQGRRRERRALRGSI